MTEGTPSPEVPGGVFDRLSKFFRLQSKGVLSNLKPVMPAPAVSSEAEKEEQAWESLATIDLPIGQGLLRNINLGEEFGERKRLVRRIRKLKTSVDLIEAYSSKEVEEKDRTEFILIGMDLETLATFDQKKAADGYPKDKIFRKLKEAAETFEKKRKWGRGIEKDLRTEEFKDEVIKMLSPGSFFAHGGFFDTLPAMLTEGGLASITTRVARGKFDDAHGHLVRGRGQYKNVDQHPHVSMIWFYSWQGRKEAGAYSGPIPAKQFAWRDNDMVILYPAHLTLPYCRVIQIDRVDPGKWADGEIGLTNSQKTLENRALTYDPQDETCLPLEMAYFVLPEDKIEETKKAFQVYGFSDEWWQEHVFPIEIKRWTEKVPGNDESNLRTDTREVLQKKKPEIDQWLAEKDFDQGKTLVKYLRRPTTSEVLYTADFVLSQGIS